MFSVVYRGYIYTVYDVEICEYGVVEGIQQSIIPTETYFLIAIDGRFEWVAMSECRAVV